MVIKQFKNDVEARHLSKGNLEVLDLDKVQLFVGSHEAAIEAANWDADQYVVAEIIAHIGDPMKRMTMSFYVRFTDNDLVWIGFSNAAHNISQTSRFEDYCRNHPELFPLLFTERDAKTAIAERNKKRITTLEPGQVFYLDLRTYGWSWFEELQLPDFQLKTYVTRCKVVKYVSRGNKLEIHDVTLDTKFFFGNHDILAHAYRRNLEKGEVLIDKELLAQFPAIKRSSLDV